uniref:ATP synthase F0 subunit 8 n=1 Tax=Austrarchaea sp. QLD TaxID=1028203 RepID=H2E3Z9_9ARAC|nr:ATP synthase F0 subunit 8 [Austrarchaea sp. QLD]
MPQLSPLFWINSFLMMVFVVISMVFIFYMNNMCCYKMYNKETKLMDWCW